MMVGRKLGSQNDTCSNLNCYTVFISKINFIGAIDLVFLINLGHHKILKRGTNE